MREDGGCVVVAGAAYKTLFFLRKVEELATMGAAGRLLSTTGADVQYAGIDREAGKSACKKK
eukprot:553938-Pyramimonas_sp.AAC.2